MWVSGFFGSGKSSFAKNLGYVLANRTVLGKRAAELFKARLNDAQCGNFIDVINKNIDTEVVMFDVQTDRASGGGAAVSISHYMYRSLLRTLDMPRIWILRILNRVWRRRTASNNWLSVLRPATVSGT